MFSSTVGARREQCSRHFGTEHAHSEPDQHCISLLFVSSGTLLKTALVHQAELVTSARCWSMADVNVLESLPCSTCGANVVV